MTDAGIPHEDITGVVLAGGQSRRMGANKALLRLGERTFIEIVVDALHFATCAVAISADDARPFSFLGLPVWPDVHTGCGPMAGIHAAMLLARTAHVMVTSCDCPLVTADMACDLADAATPGETTVVSDGARVQPLLGVYPVDCGPSADDYLRTGGRSVLGFLETLRRPAVVLLRPAWRERLKNINDPADARALVLTPC